MILCVSLNPAMDSRLTVDSLRIGGVTRARSTRAFPGGKAAHVALVARALGSHPAWLGFLGGATGDQLAAGLKESGIRVTAVRTKTPTRVNLEILDAAGISTEVLEPGALVDSAGVEEMFSSCRQSLQGAAAASAAGASFLVLSGSLPPGVPTDFYARLIREAHAHGVSVLLDTSGEALIAGLAAQPEFVKPNRSEAESATGTTLHNLNDAVRAARWMLSQGARRVAMSLGAEGLLWCAEESAAPSLALAPAISGRSTVGCGDAVVAGLAVAAERGLPPEEALRLAAACGAANCLADSPGVINRGDVERLLFAVVVRSVT